jgi:voltage-gated potassium channel
MLSIIFKRFFKFGLFLICLLLFGSFGYLLITGFKYGFVDCLYMTVITVTTVGFTEVIDTKLYPDTRYFSMILAFVGFGFSTYFLTRVIVFLVEGELKKNFKIIKMLKEINNLCDHYILCGVGRVGSHILNELNSTGHPVVIIENSEERISVLSETYKDLKYIRGDADVDENLNKAGIMKAKGVFAVTGDDNQNLVISLSAKFLNPKVKVVARCLDAMNQEKMKKAGADYVVSENFIAGMRIASQMIRPKAVDFLDIMLQNKDENLRVEDILINDKFTNKMISDLNLKDFPRTLLLAVASGDKWFFMPNLEFIIPENSKILVITNPKDKKQISDLISR